MKILYLNFFYFSFLNSIYSIPLYFDRRRNNDLFIAVSQSKQEIDHGKTSNTSTTGL